jgi:SAM-dependent methyltransferase
MRFFYWKQRYNILNNNVETIINFFRYHEIDMNLLVIPFYLFRSLDDIKVLESNINIDLSKDFDEYNFERLELYNTLLETLLSHIKGDDDISIHLFRKADDKDLYPLLSKYMSYGLAMKIFKRQPASFNWVFLRELLYQGRWEIITTIFPNNDIWTAYRSSYRSSVFYSSREDRRSIYIFIEKGVPEDQRSRVMIDLLKIDHRGAAKHLLDKDTERAFIKGILKYRKSDLVREWLRGEKLDIQLSHPEDGKELFSYLLDVIEGKDEEGNTCIMVISRMLMKRFKHLWKDTVDETDQNDRSIIDLLACTKDCQMKSLLKQFINCVGIANCKINIITIIKMGHFHVIKYLLESEDILSHERFNTETYLSAACCNTDIRVLKHILKKFKDRSDTWMIYIDRAIDEIVQRDYISNKYKILRINILYRALGLNMTDILLNISDGDLAWYFLKKYDCKVKHSEHLSRYIQSFDTLSIKIKFIDYCVDNNKILDIDIWTVISNIISRDISWFSDTVQYLMKYAPDLEDYKNKDYLARTLITGYTDSKTARDQLIVFKEADINLKVAWDILRYCRNDDLLDEICKIDNIINRGFSVYYVLESRLTKWIKVKYYIRRYVRRRYHKAFSAHKTVSQTFRDDILYAPPTGIFKGGSCYLECSRSFNQIAKTYKRVIPRHATIGELLYLSRKDIVISPKADGIYTRTDLSDAYPLLGIGIDVEAEYIRDLDIYLVFNVIPNDETLEMNYYERLKWLRNKNNVKDICSFRQGNRGRLWCIKDFHLFKDPKDTLLSLDNKVDTLYKTDGYILTTLDGQTIIKYKPLEEMTIDLYCDGTKWMTKERTVIDVKSKKKGIWRCHYQDGWIAKDFRPEKTSPNPDKVVKEVENLIFNPWRAKDLVSMLDNIYYHELAKNVLHPNTRQFLNVQSETFREWLKDIKGDVLDLGCGKGKLAKYNKDMVGVDIDPIVIWKAKTLYPNKTWISQDLNKGLNLDQRFDSIVMNFSIHYFYKKIFEIIENHTHQDSKLYISILDVDLLRNSYTFEDGYLRKKDCQIELFYRWAHSYPIFENVVSGESMIADLRKRGWKISKILDPKGIVLNYKYKIFQGAHCWLTFERV